MKTVFTKKEGVWMNFGDTKNIAHEFIYLMDNSDLDWGTEFKYFYRITDDNYIQLAHRLNGGELKISAQFRLRFKNLKENIIFIVKENIEAHLPYEGFPVFEKSTVITEKEFNSIIQTIRDERNLMIEQAIAFQTPLIDYLREKNLNPRPSGNNPYSWVAKCPCGGNHFLMIVTKTDNWGCGYCRRVGKLPELQAWLKEIKIKEDQKRLSKMLRELKENGGLSKETTKWWLKRY
ncbi:hypothetical protein [Aestuariivivens sediminicola]|uniref:hypothetical protein n=1 Tax=Aestuariivivens sediminicola TaxID=2913560 RepID=UPI001F5AAA1E|nr:hypothetical protein [Aestuariivivens sediminicola]